MGEVVDKRPGCTCCANEHLDAGTALLCFAWAVHENGAVLKTFFDSLCFEHRRHYRRVADELNAARDEEASENSPK